MPFLAIFRKDKDKDASRSKTPVPLSPAPASTASRKSSTFSRTRPSFTSSRSCVSPPPQLRTLSPPPQLANISPHSDFDYVLPDLDAPSVMGLSPAPEPEKELAQVPEVRPVSPPIKPRRGLPFGRRRGSASSGVIVAAGSATPTPRPFSEALDSFMSRMQQETERDRDPDRPRGLEAPTHAPPLSNPESITSKNVTSATITTTTTPNTWTTLEELDSDDDPLVPPPTRASVFGGYAYSDKDIPSRSQSLPDVDLESRESDMVRSESGHSRPPRPQVHPHQLARGKNKSVDLNSLLVASAPTPTLGSSAASDSGAPIKTKQKDASTKSSGGLFGWRSKNSKEVPAAAAPAPIVTADPAESSFSLKSFRHVGPASIPSSPVAQPGSALGSSTNVNAVGISANHTATPAAVVSTPPSSYGRTSPAPGVRPIPGRTGTSRERVNSTSSEGVMTAGLFRQAARRSNTNLVDEASTSPRSSVVRDREKRGPPTRTWDVRDKDGDVSSSSERGLGRPQLTTRPPEGATSDRSGLGVGGKPRAIGRSSSAMPYVGSGESSPEGTSPFTSALSKLGEESPLARSGFEGGGAQSGYARSGARSDGGFRSVSAAATPAPRPGPQPVQPRPGIGAINVRPEMRGVNARPVPPSSGPGPQSVRPSPQTSNSPPGPQPASQSSVPRPGPQPASRPGPPRARSNSPTKPRQSAPTAMGRSPVRTTIPTKTNDGPSIKPRASSPIKMSGRPPSPAASIKLNRSISGSPTKSIVGSPAKSVTGSPVKTISNTPIKSSLRRSSIDNTTPGHSRYASTDTYRAKSPIADMNRAKSPNVGMSRAKSPAPSASRPTDMTRAKSPGPAPRTGYVPPPRQSSLAHPAGMDLDSDEDESEEAESEDDGFGTRPVEKKVVEKERVGGSDSFGARVAGTPEVGALRGRGGSASPFASRQGSSSNTGHDGLSRERTITQRTAGSGRASPTRDEAPKAPPKVGVSLFDRPTPSFDKSSSSSLSSSPFDKFGAPPVAPGRGPARGRASHSTSAISAAATARNSAAIAEANRRSGHNRGAPSASSTSGRPSHIRAPAEGTDTDEDEDDGSETDSEDNAPLSVLTAPRRPGSSTSNAPSMVRSLARTPKPLVDMSGSNGAPPPRPPRRVPGVGVTRNSSLRGSRSVEDLGRMTMAPGSVIGVSGRPGPRPFVVSPPSSTGDSSSGKAPLTPRDGSEAGGRRLGSALGPAGEEARRKERRRGEAKASVELGNVINGPGPLNDDDGDMSSHHSQMGHGGMGMMGWGQPGLFPQMTGFQGFPASQSMPFAGSFPTSQSMPFIPPPPPPGASEQYVVAHQQAMMMAKQAYLSAVAQQAMAFATEQWERSSNAGGSVYGGSQMGGMMGMPMMGMYANSAYAASMYEGSVVGGGGGWGSASAYGGRSVYGGGGAGAKSEYGGGMKSSPTKSMAGGPGRSRLRAQTATSEMPAPANRGNPVPPSTWTTRRKGGPA